MKNANKALLVIGIAIMFSGCISTTATRPSIQTMEILNERLSNIEKELNTRPPRVVQEEEKKKVLGIYSRRKLTDSQKEFIELMMEYLEKK